MRSEPSLIEFEMAYQSLLEIDRIRFAIKQTEQLGAGAVQKREVSLQLLDALERLETVDRLFQERSPRRDPSGQTEKLRAHSVISGTGKSSSHGTRNNI